MTFRTSRPPTIRARKATERPRVFLEKEGVQRPLASLSPSYDFARRRSNGRSLPGLSRTGPALSSLFGVFSIYSVFYRRNRRESRQERDLARCSEVDFGGDGHAHGHEYTTGDTSGHWARGRNGNRGVRVSGAGGVGTFCATNAVRGQTRFLGHFTHRALHVTYGKRNKPMCLIQPEIISK